LPDEEIERLDEMSIADDQFAARLSAVEHDLVDAYVKGELSGDTLSRFQTHYLSAPANREKVDFAETWLEYQSRPLGTRAVAAPARGWLRLARVPAWGLAAAAMLVLAASTYLLVDTVRMRHLMTNAQLGRAALEQRERQLQAQLDEQRSADAALTKELASVRESLAQLEARLAGGQGGSRLVSAFVLLAATRGAGEIATIAFPPQTEAVILLLNLESDALPAYRAALRDPATDRIVWRSELLHATSGGGVKSLSVTLPANLLKPQAYMIEVSGVPARGAAEIVGSYPFRVVAR
jgi:hypothetical protein